MIRGAIAASCHGAMRLGAACTIAALCGCAASQGSNSVTDGANSNVLEQGIVAHWCFDHPDRPAADCSKGGYDGFIAGNVTLAPGVVGQAANFDGNSWIDVPSPFFLDGLCQATIASFIWLDNLDHMGQILGGGDPRGGTDPLSFQLEGGRLSNVGFEDIPSLTWIKAPDEATPRFETGRWYHFATTLDTTHTGSRLQIYLNGLLVDEIEEPGARCIGYDIAMPTQIGAIHESQRWNGAIDELRVYHRPLSAEEVALLAAPLPQ
jgi:hypothetical protein